MEKDEPTDNDVPEGNMSLKIELKATGAMVLSFESIEDAVRFLLGPGYHREYAIEQFAEHLQKLDSDSGDN